MKSLRRTMLVGGLLLSAGCSTNAPPEVLFLHTREQELTDRIRISHLALVDRYYEARVELFDQFYIEEYLPSYFENWKESYAAETGNKYDAADPQQNQLWHNDLLAEYEELAAPLTAARDMLRSHLGLAYAQAREMRAHIGDWIKSVQELNEAQRDAVNRLLQTIDQGMTLDSIDNALRNVQEEAEKRISSFIGG